MCERSCWTGDRTTHRGRSCAHAAGRAHARHAPPTPGGDGRVPGRARLGRHHDDRRQRAGRRLPGRAAAPLPEQAGPRRRRGRAPERATSRRHGRRCSQTCPRPAACARCSTCSPPSSSRRSSSPRSSCGSRPARTPSCARPSDRWNAASAVRPTSTRWSCSASTSRAATTGRSCRPPSTCCAASASPPRSATTASVVAPCSTPGPTVLDDSLETLMNDLRTAVIADLDAESAQLDGWVAPLDADEWTTGHHPGGLDHRPPDRASRTGPTRRRSPRSPTSRPSTRG